MITERTIAGIDKGDKVWDSKVSGFYAHANKDGSVTFGLRKRCNGIDRSIKIGRHPEWGVAEARAQAMEYAVQMDKGVDPLLERRQRCNAPTFSHAWDDLYEVRILSKKNLKAQKDERSMYLRYVNKAIGSKRLADITMEDIQKIHDFITARRKPVRANRVLQVLRCVFNRAIDAGWMAANPARGVKRNPESPRERYLTGEEVERLLEALANHSNQRVADIIRFLMLTGARRGETLKAEWDHFDLENGRWMKPSAHTKQKRIHTVPLSADAVDLLRRVRQRTNSRYVFPQVGNPEAPSVEVKRFWADILNAAGIKDLRIHDLRHHFATVLASSGLSLPIIGRLLGHTQQATTARYAHLMIDPLRDATSIAAEKININRNSKDKK